MFSIFYLQIVYFHYIMRHIWIRLKKKLSQGVTRDSKHLPRGPINSACWSQTGLKPIQTLTCYVRLHSVGRSKKLHFCWECACNFWCFHDVSPEMLSPMLPCSILEASGSRDVAMGLFEVVAWKQIGGQGHEPPKHTWANGGQEISRLLVGPMFSGSLVSLGL